MNPRLDRYFESEVLTADPIQLVTLLYRAAREAIAAASVALAAGDIQERSRNIQKAWEIIHELDRVLDRQRGGDISRQLAELYAYVGQKLLDANTQQSQQGLDDAAAVLAILAEAWQGVQKHQTAEVLSGPMLVTC